MLFLVLPVFSLYFSLVTFLHEWFFLPFSLLNSTFPRQETHRSQHDHFHEQLERSAADSFTVVADYLGRGVFTHLQSLSALYPPLNTTRSKMSTYQVLFPACYSLFYGIVLVLGCFWETLCGHSCGGTTCAPKFMNRGWSVWGLERSNV